MISRGLPGTGCEKVVDHPVQLYPSETLIA
jgi:hypothetical protein